MGYFQSVFFLKKKETEIKLLKSNKTVQHAVLEIILEIMNILN